VIQGDAAKKLFPYSDQLAYHATVIDLDARCEAVKAPKVEHAKREMKRGGPEKCFGGVEHDFQRSDVYEAESEPNHPAAKAGALAWEVCQNGETEDTWCEAWREVETEEEREGIPRGWQPPTWREVLGKALAAKAPAGAEVKVEPTQIAIDPTGKARQLFDTKAAQKAIEAAGLATFNSEAREPSRTTPQKPPPAAPDLEETVRAKALEQLAAEASKGKADPAFWRMLVALVVRTVDPVDSRIVRVAGERRGIEKAPVGKAVELLLKLVAKYDEAQCRGLVVELLAAADETGSEDDVFAIASRFYKVDMRGIERAERARIEAAKKEAAKPAGKAKAKEAGSASAELSHLHRTILTLGKPGRTLVQVTAGSKPYAAAQIKGAVDVLVSEKRLELKGQKLHTTAKGIEQLAQAAPAKAEKPKATPAKGKAKK
jgi:hypothetical protein